MDVYYSDNYTIYFKVYYKKYNYTKIYMHEFTYTIKILLIH